MDRCNALIAQFCARAVDCYKVPAAQQQQALQACVQATATGANGIDCSKAVGTTSEYDLCWMQVTTFQCLVLFPGAASGGGMSAQLPTACTHVIQLAK